MRRSADAAIKLVVGLETGRKTATESPLEQMGIDVAGKDSGDPTPARECGTGGWLCGVDTSGGMICRRQRKLSKSIGRPEEEEGEEEEE